MKSWIIKNRLYLTGALAGGIVGFFYWKFIGCTSGTCMISSKPVNSTIYFALMGALLFGMFKKSKTLQEDKNSSSL